MANHGVFALSRGEKTMGCEETNYYYNCLQSELVSILGVSLQKNNNKVSEGTANAVGCLVDFQLV